MGGDPFEPKIMEMAEEEDGGDADGLVHEKRAGREVHVGGPI